MGVWGSLARITASGWRGLGVWIRFGDGWKFFFFLEGEGKREGEEGGGKYVEAEDE
jgi:hypothetical protein